MCFFTTKMVTDTTVYLCFHSHTTARHFPQYRLHAPAQKETPGSLLPKCCIPSRGTARESLSCFHEHPVLGSDPHNPPSCSTVAALHLAGCVQSTTNSHFCWPCFYLFLVLNRGANDTSSISKNQKVKQISKRPRCYMLYLT